MHEVKCRGSKTASDISAEINEGVAKAPHAIRCTLTDGRQRRLTQASAGSEGARVLPAIRGGGEAKRGVRWRDRDRQGRWQ